MDYMLDENEARVLGCLIEKEMTTPEYYPLSLNALTNACNQKSNRHPVVSLTEPDVEEALDGLQKKMLARKTETSGSRVSKYAHSVLSHFDLSRQDMAVLCELLVRGPQTPGELRSRADRMAPFGSLEEVEGTLRTLMEHDPQLVTKLARETGRKECRYMHLFSGEPVEESATGESSPDSAPRMSTSDRVSALEEEVSKLRSELEELKKAFAEFRSQF